ncbi:MAG: MaoC family dehydratase [Nitratireductor sp.]|nr:MaoC family dehydratase [Nitratireductor sp.]
MNLPPFFAAGHVEQLGDHLFTADEIMAFARKYDPQIFHLDPEAAKQSVLGGLCASGWHTVAMWMRKQRDHSAELLPRLEREGHGKVEYGPSPGFSSLRWIRPVYAGDTVSYSSETLTCRPSASRPGWHVMSARNVGVNQHGQPVLSFESTVLVKHPA